jgi:anti-sigma regulatory factor (Ser/Thr protein kinase)
LGEHTESVALLVSEVVTNAVTQSDGAIVLRLRRAPRALYVEVSDSDTRVPRLRPSALEDEKGRGLQLVDGIAERWGVRPLAEGKVVWFEIPIRPGRC